jgi:hypothetical protein
MEEKVGERQTVDKRRENGRRAKEKEKRIEERE